MRECFWFIGWGNDPSTALPLNKIKIPFLPKITHTAFHTSPPIYPPHIWLYSPIQRVKEKNWWRSIYCKEVEEGCFEWLTSAPWQPNILLPLRSGVPTYIRCVSGFMLTNVKALVNMILVKHNKFKHPLWGIIYGIRYSQEVEEVR